MAGGAETSNIPAPLVIARLAAHPDEDDENSEAKQREAYDIF